MSLTRRDEVFKSLKKRADVFMDMLSRGMLEGVTMDMSSSFKVVLLLDSFVILLEGGTDLDLTVLQLPEIVDDPNESTKSDRKDDHSKYKDTKKRQHSSTDKSDDEISDNDSKKKLRRELLKKTDDSGDEKKRKRDENQKDRPNKDFDDDSSDEGRYRKWRYKYGRESAKERIIKKSDDERSDDEKSYHGSSDKEDVKKPRALHKTLSVFLRTISRKTSRAELEAVCCKYPGFIRVTMAEPQPEQHWFRRGWATFSPSTDIKQTCWALNNIKLNDVELGAIVNRELNNRVRSVTGITSVDAVVRSDLKLAVKLIQALDSQAGLWPHSGKPDENKSLGLIFTNPILQGITDLLVDEASAEEEELLGHSEGPLEHQEDKAGKTVDVLKVLDRLVLYLRMVHSVDFYNSSHYPSEDEMPHRCGIMHLRGEPSKSEVTNQDINEYCEGFRGRLQTVLMPAETLAESEVASLGRKSHEEEVEKFVTSNSQEVSKDRWVCPLSGKKFKGPEFVRKHIFNKYADRLDEVRLEVDYFNNYLKDPKRPQLPEAPSFRIRREPFHDLPHQFPYYRGRGHYSFLRGRGYLRPSLHRFLDHRPIITYTDLDAPAESSENI